MLTALPFGFAGAKVREKIGLTKLFPYFFLKTFSLLAVQGLRVPQLRELLLQELQHPWSG